MDPRLQHAPVGVLEVRRDGVVEAANAKADALLGGVDAGAHVADAFPHSVEESVPAAFEGDAVPDREFEEYYPGVDRWLAVTIRPVDGDAVVYVEDVTERRRREQTVERFRTERARTAVIDALLSDVLAELADAHTREEIAETICTRLGETDLYEFAWVGERAVGGDGVAVKAAAGDTGETFDAVRDALDADAETPEERALRTGDLRAVQPLAEDEAAPEAVRRAGFADGVQSLLAIPLVHAGTVHGVVGVYASSDGFSDRERASFRTLGEMAGFAVTAARNRNLLLSDTATEVAFEVGGDAALARVAADLDASVSLDGVVPQGDDALLCYVAVDGCALEGGDADALGSAVPGVSDVRVVTATDDGGTLELDVRADSPLLAVSRVGATVRTAAFEAGRGRVVAALPPDGDAGRMVDAVRREFDAEVAAKRERERSAPTARDLRDELGDRLTDRQATVLRTAYLADYFESPRGSTAEEVADSLDITGSTLLHHLRASQRKLLDAYFADDAARDGRE